MGLWDTLIGAGSSILGGVLGGFNGAQGQNTGKNVTNTEPWKVQQPYLQAGFANAADIYRQQMNSPFYQGPLYAGMNDMQRGAATGAGQFAIGEGMGLSQGMINDSRAYLGQTGNFLNAANRMAGFNPADPTQQNIQNAGQYADNPYLDGAIDAASRDVKRNLTEDVLPGINRGASGGGNTNSTRTGIAEGVALRGAQDRIGDIASTVRADAYNNGLSLSEQGRQANMQGYLSGQGMGLDALNSALDRGMNLRNQGMQGVVNMYDILGRAGDKYQQDAQGYYDSQFKRWEGNQNQPWKNLGNYMGAVGGQNWGSSSTSTDSRPGSTWGAIQGALGGATAGLGLYQNFAQLMNNNNRPSNQGFY